ncbi:MAG: PHP domain-containing protein [Hornefia sp.]|nr:PHP domain-containing protein [Hornefia sp.]
MALKMDLHTHSTYSDGKLKPVELVKKYHDEEYGIIAITDHDTVKGVAEAKIAGEALEMQVIAGIELGTIFEDELKLHILGYYIDIENDRLREITETLKKAREKRNRELLAILNKQGFDISEYDLTVFPGQKYIGKPHFAIALKNKGYISQAKEAFEDGKFLETAEAKAIDNICIDTADAVEVIKGAGGISVLAHPMKIKGLGEKGSDIFFENLEILLRKLKKLGLKGIECFHPSADHEDGLRLVRLADKFHLHITHGSDFHGMDI